MSRIKILVSFYLLPVLMLGVFLGLLVGFVIGETLASRMQECSYHYGNPWEKYSAPKDDQKKYIPLRNDI